MKKIDFFALFFSLLFLLYFIAIIVTNNTKYDVCRYSINHTLVDYTFGFIGLLGLLVSPIVLIISYIKKIKIDNVSIKSIIPLIISLIIFTVISLITSIYFKQFSLKLFLIPGLYLVLYSIAIFCSIKYKKHSI